jgi:hypothetical protein
MERNNYDPSSGKEKAQDAAPTSGNGKLLGRRAEFRRNYQASLESDRQWEAGGRRDRIFPSTSKDGAKRDTTAEQKYLATFDADRRWERWKTL